MSTARQQPEQTPELTIFTRVVTIPVVHDSIGYLDQTLSSNSYLRMPYATAQAISFTAFEMSKPITSFFAPILTRADGLANQAVDVVENRYPYPFKTPAQDMANDLKAQADHAKNVTQKTIDERVVNPVHTVVNGVDAVRALRLLLHCRA
jgi:hypothetical protein